MDLRWKVVVPIAAAATAVFVATTFVQGRSAPLVVALVAVGSLALVAWHVVDIYLQQPLQRLLAEADNQSNNSPFKPDLMQRMEHALAVAREARATNLDTLTQEREIRIGIQRALRESEERYELAVRGANDGLWEWDLKTNQMYLSPRWKGMLGFGDDDFPDTADAWKGRIFSEDLARFETALREHLHGTTSHLQSEHRVIHKDGSYRWVMSRATAIRHAKGTPYRMVGLDTDMTHFKRVEDVLFHVARGTANATGETFFRRMVEHFALALKVRIVFITRCLDSPVTRMRAVACWDTGQFVDKEYALEPTPCKKVIEQRAPYFIPQDLNVQYPQSNPPEMCSYLGIPIFGREQRLLGHIVFKDDKKMDESMLMDSVYQIFMARAGVEIERMEEQQALLEIARGDGELPSDERLKQMASLLTGANQGI